MSPTLLIAVISIFLAAIVYTIVIFAQRKSGVVKPWHLILLCLGVVYDTTSTVLMSKLAKSPFTAHGIAGYAANGLMVLLTIFAGVILFKKDEKLGRIFSKISLYIWVLWMISFVLGIIVSQSAH